MGFFGKLIKGIATGGLSALPRGSKNPLVSVLAGMPLYNPFGRPGSSGGGKPPINPIDMSNAQAFMRTFSPEDQANIRAGVNNPYEMIDWYRGASKAAGWQPGGGGLPPLPVAGGVPTAAAPAPPPVEQPVDYQALAEEKKRKQAWRAGLPSNKPTS